MALASKKIKEVAEKAERKELERFIREIVKDEVERLLNAKYDSETTLTVNEVKEKYKISISTIDRYCKNGILVPVGSPLQKSRRLFKKADCDAVFLKEKK